MLLVLIPTVSARCLETEQETLLFILANNNNFTDAEKLTFINMFEIMFCSASNNFTKEYFDSEMDAFKDDTYDWMNETDDKLNQWENSSDTNIDTIIEQKFNNYSAYIQDKLDLVDAMNSIAIVIGADDRIDEIRAELMADYVTYTETTDDKIRDMKEEFILNNNITYTQYEPTPAYDYSTYYFIGFIIIVAISYFAHKRGWIEWKKPIKQIRPGKNMTSSNYKYTSTERQHRDNVKDDTELQKLREENEEYKLEQERKNLFDAIEKKKKQTNKLKDSVKDAIDASGGKDE